MCLNYEFYVINTFSHLQCNCYYLCFSSQGKFIYVLMNQHGTIVPSFQATPSRHNPSLVQAHRCRPCDHHIQDSFYMSSCGLRSSMLVPFSIQRPKNHIMNSTEGESKSLPWVIFEDGYVIPSHGFSTILS